MAVYAVVMFTCGMMEQISMQCWLAGHCDGPWEQRRRRFMHMQANRDPFCRIGVRVVPTGALYCRRYVVMADPPAAADVGDKKNNPEAVLRHRKIVL